MDTSDWHDASADARDAARLRQIMDGAVEHALIEMDLDRRVRGWNVGAERLFGLSAEAALGRSADVIFTAEDRAAQVPVREVERALRTGRAEDALYHLRGDGTPFWASSVTTPLRDADGEPDGLLKIVRDQSGMRAAEEALVYPSARLQPPRHQHQGAAPHPRIGTKPMTRSPRGHRT